MTDNRTTLPEIFMEIAVSMSHRSTCSKRASVGCVIVKNNRVIATGYNGAPHGFPHCDDVGCVLDTDGHCIVSVHAEENALLQCARHGVMIGHFASIYTTHSPCPRCVCRLAQVGVRQIFYKEEFYDIALSKSIASTLHMSMCQLNVVNEKEVDDEPHS